MLSPRDILAVMVKARGNDRECDQCFILADRLGVMSHDRPPSDRQICALNTIGQFIDITSIMPWLEVCLSVSSFLAW